MTRAVVIVAAGTGTRLAQDRPGPKALIPVGGRTLLEHALDRVLRVQVDEVVVVHTPGHGRAFAAVIGGRADALVAGGASRAASVRAGAAAVTAGHDVIAVHDAARAFTPPEVLRTALEAVGGHVVAAAPAVPVADTLKEQVGDGIVRTVDRTGLWAVQTPQVFARVAWDAALRWAGAPDATDDLGLLEQAIAAGAVQGRVRLVPGSRLGFKVTYPEDLLIAAALAGGVGSER